jgi:hypothetical protein
MGDVMRYSNHKELNKLVLELVSSGSTFWWGGKHGRLRLPSGAVLTVPGTPSSPYAVKTFAGAVKRAIRKMKRGP